VTTGNKLRKLEFYLAEAEAQRADVLLTAGSPSSNHCRTVAVVAREAGMDSALLLEGPAQPPLDGNFLLMALVGARVRTVPAGSSYDWEAELADMADRLRAEGRRPYIIPLGGTGELGVTGYVKAAEELKVQCDARGLRPDAVTLTVGSCSTYAGLLLGARVWGLGCPIVGISISGLNPERTSKTRKWVERTAAFLGTGVCVPDEDYRLLDTYRGAGYGLATPEVYGFIGDFGRRTGLVLDPVYTGKALHGVLQEMRAGCLQDARDVVFIHTGGVFGLFQRKSGFSLTWRRI
jgi:D-cysteine desulfhydrase